MSDNGDVPHGPSEVPLLDVANAGRGSTTPSPSPGPSPSPTNSQTLIDEILGEMSPVALRMPRLKSPPIPPTIPFQPDISKSSAMAPLIHISTDQPPPAPAKQTEDLGIDNQAFMDDLLDELRTGYDVKPSVDNPVGATNVDNLRVPQPGQIKVGRSVSLTPTVTDSIDDYLSPSLVPPPSPGALSTRTNWSELITLARHDSIGSYHSVQAPESRMSSHSGVTTAMSQRIKQLVQRFNSRTEYFKEKAVQPPTPSSGSLGSHSVVSGVSDTGPSKTQHLLESFTAEAPSPSLEEANRDHYVTVGRARMKIPKMIYRLKFPTTIDPNRKLYICWLFLVTSAFMYNMIAIPLRGAFTEAKFFHKDNVTTTNLVSTETNTTNTTNTTSIPPIECYNETRSELVTRYYAGYQTEGNTHIWWIFDYLMDLIYIIDIILIRVRVRFINNGLVERDKKLVMKHYMTEGSFQRDLASLVPSDLLYFIPGVSYSALVRMPRLLKIHVMWELYDRLDTLVKSAHFVRVARTLTYMLLLIHVEGCGYYAMSAYEGLAMNEWVYDGQGIAYVRCIYLATKTATSIGNNPKPENQLEYGFMTVYWLSGVFVFAMLIGQIRDIFQSATAAKEQYKKTMDQTLDYMNSLDLPKNLQSRVRSWFIFNWEHQKTLNENSLLEALPQKMKADLAIHVHYKTLCKVQLFQDCDKNLLFDLVLKLNPVLYLPGDYICKKGEVGTEMYIVMHGQVEVVGGPNNTVVFATLHEGSVFGEISLLALAGGNRRTADVRSKGFAQIFLLYKADFQEAMSNYPEAQKMLKRRAKKLLAQNAKNVEKAEQCETQEVIKSRMGTPKLVHTVIKVVGPDSNIPGYLGVHNNNHRHRRASDVSAHSGDSNQNVKHFNDEDDDEEYLVVERTERPASVDEDDDHSTQLHTPIQSDDHPPPNTETLVKSDDRPQSPAQPTTEPQSTAADDQGKRQEDNMNDDRSTTSLSVMEEAIAELARSLQTTPASLNSEMASLLASPTPSRLDRHSPDVNTTPSKFSIVSEEHAPLPVKKQTINTRQVPAKKSSTETSPYAISSKRNSNGLKKINKVAPVGYNATGKGKNGGLSAGKKSSGQANKSPVVVKASAQKTSTKIGTVISVETVSDEAIREATEIIEQAIEDTRTMELKKVVETRRKSNENDDLELSVEM